MADQFHARCYICGKRDENEDPTLWIVCTPDDPHDQCCRLPCHIDCAFDSECIGVINNDQFRPLDAHYWCISCGKVSDILGLWKQQVGMAKDARFMEDLYKRLSLSYKLMDKSVRFEALHEYVRVAKEMVEAKLHEPISHCSKEVGRSTVGNHSFARDVYKLCINAIEKAEELMASKEWESRVDRYPPACRVIFEEISSTSIKIILMDIPTARIETIIGFNIWCWRSKHEDFRKDQDLSFPTSKNRATISSLKPLTEYTILIVSYIQTGAFGIPDPFGITGVKCTTKPTENVHDEPGLNPPVDPDQNDILVQEEINDITREDDVASPKLAELPDLNTNGEPVLPDLNDVLVLPDLNAEPSAEPLLNEICEEPITGNIEKDVVEENEPGPSVPPFRGWSRRDCVSMIFNLEREGLLTENFRMRFVTWFGVKAKEEERHLVYAYFEALFDKPKGLAQQLVHSFSDII